MISADPAPLAQQFRDHFGHREHLYGELLAVLADDLEAGGPTLDIVRGHLDAPRGQATSLRLLAGMHRVVLRGEEPELAAFYPTTGGDRPFAEVGEHVRPVLERHAEELRLALDLAPQTNEVGRSALLAVGLFEAVRRTGLRRVRLLEPGASAGLNLNVDHYRFTGPGWAWGPEDSPLQLDTDAAGVRPEELEVVARRGCDLAPVDASTPEGARYLTSFVWPFDVARHARLAAALEVARAHPVTVDRAPAASWLAEQLAVPADDGVLTVVWQSITQQYWPAAESAAVEQTIAEARSRMPLAHIHMEGVPPQDGAYTIEEHGPQTRLDGDVLARSHHHGPPVRPKPARSLDSDAGA